MKAAVILGAGASASAGLPMLKSVFTDATVKEYLHGDGSFLLRFLEKHIWAPRGLTLESSERGPNIEEILTLLKFWRKAEGRGGIDSILANYSPVCFRDHAVLNRQLLGCVYHAVYHKKRDNSDRSYGKLIMATAKLFNQVDWCSFNWDAKLEQAFYYVNRQETSTIALPTCNRMISGWEGNDPCHHLSKMHGSVTWFQDPSGRVQYCPFGATKARASVDDAWSEFLKGKDSQLPVIAEPHSLKHEAINNCPVLLSEWRYFASALGEANVILSIGYSLPDGDLMAKQLLMTISARRRPTRIILVDPANDSEWRYNTVFGKDRVIHHKLKLEEFVDMCSSHPEVLLGK